uniref:Uncharacterized protein n=1 Tax=Neogobius melanostomus TaxID=47308 RepID=A0A8C6WEM2_9GOBI
MYLKACYRLGTVPVHYFLRHLGLSSLNLNHHGVGPLGMKALAMVLQYDNSLTNLELEDNSLGVEGTHYVVKMLQLNTKINSLVIINEFRATFNLAAATLIISTDIFYRISPTMTCNGFDDNSAKYLAEALKGDYVIRELDLSHNKFSTTGGEHLGEMLACNVGIEVLNLSWNNLNMKGAVALCAGLKVTLKTPCLNVQAKRIFDHCLEYCIFLSNNFNSVCYIKFKLKYVNNLSLHQTVKPYFKIVLN